MKKNCLVCGAAFSGRSDKKFCSDNCRSTYHNQRNAEIYRSIRETHSALRRNRRILLRLLAGRTTLQIPYAQLLRAGFQPDICTGIRRRGRRPLQYVCYELGYQILPGEQILVYYIAELGDGAALNSMSDQSLGSL